MKSLRVIALALPLCATAAGCAMETAPRGSELELRSFIGVDVGDDRSQVATLLCAAGARRDLQGTWRRTPGSLEPALERADDGACVILPEARNVTVWTTAATRTSAANTCGPGRDLWVDLIFESDTLAAMRSECQGPGPGV